MQCQKHKNFTEVGGSTSESNVGKLEQNYTLGKRSSTFSGGTGITEVGGVLPPGDSVPRG